MVACSIAGVIGWAASASADPLVKIATSPIYLSQVSIGRPPVGSTWPIAPMARPSVA